MMAESALKICIPEKKGIALEYIPESFMVSGALSPYFKHKLKSSGP